MAEGRTIDTLMQPKTTWWFPKHQ